MVKLTAWQSLQKSLLFTVNDFFPRNTDPKIIMSCISQYHQGKFVVTLPYHK